MSHARPANLTWQEMICLHEERIGLRSVPKGIAGALEEQKSGGRGDAVSLAAFSFPGAENLKLSDDPNTLIPFVDGGGKILMAYKVLVDEKVMDARYASDKAILLARFHEGIYKHLKTSIEIFDTRSFILVRMGQADLPIDFDSYVLGKCGTQNFEAKQVKGVINPPLDNLLWNTDIAFDAVIKEIKTFCQAKILEKQPSIYHPNKFFTHQENILKSKQSEKKSDFVSASKRRSWCVIL